MSGGALEASVTLEDVFAVVGSKRVPLAPELAGYLALEITERADPEGGDIDPKSVFVSEEGTVALVKPKRESPLGEAESSIRAALTRLIEASGSQTPALAAACKRKSGVGLPALAQELEAALIPVNRAAGRRALARLAREVKRVTLGVGRHTLPSSPDSSLRPGGRALGLPPNDPGTPSSPQGEPPSGPLPDAERPQPVTAPGNRPRVARFSPEEDPTTTRKQLPEELRASAPLLDPRELPTTQFKPARDPSPSQADVDDLIADFAVSGDGEQQHARELRALAGLEPTPAPPSRLSPPLARLRAVPAESHPADADLEALLALGHESPKDDNRLRSRSAPPSERTPGAAGRNVRFDPRQIPTQPSQLRQSRAAPPTVPAARSRYGAWAAIVVALLAVGGGAYAVRDLQRGLFAVPGRAGDRRTVGARGTDAPMPSPSELLSSASTPACKGTLVVSDIPARAEVLLRVGQAPVDVERMPVGARLEFVATAEGYAAKRIVVPSRASWDTGPDGTPRFDADAQLDPFAAPPGALDPWPPAEPGSAVGGQGPPGTVHVTTSPRGAEVWMVAGVGPQARIEQLSCERDIEVLVAGPTARHRLHVAKSDFVFDDRADAAGSTPGASRVARISSR